MTILRTRRSPARHSTGPADRAQPSSTPPTCRFPIPANARSCCCPSAPVAQVIMPANGGRPTEVDLLLCAHHLRASAAALRAAGAAVFDSDGLPVDEVTSVFALDPAYQHGPAEPART